MRLREKLHLLLRFALAWAFVAFVAVDIYVWVGRMTDPPLVGFYAVAAEWPGFWLTFHTALVLFLVGGLAEAVLVTDHLVRVRSHF